MIRGLKALGTALAAVLAIGAVGAGFAQATPVFEAESYPATLDSESLQPTIFKLGTEVRCEKAALSGTLETVGGKAPSTLTINRTYSECTTTFGMNVFPTTVVMSGCAFLLHASEKVDALNYKATVDVECQTGGKIEFLVYESKTKHDNNETACKFTIPAQNGLKTVELINKEAIPPDIQVKPNVSGIKYEVDGPALLCGKGNTNGTYTGNGTVTATNAAKEQIWLSVTGE